MSTFDGILFTCFALGFVLMFFGVLATNIAVQKMRMVLNASRAPEDQLKWHDAFQKVAQDVINAYRTTYPDGPLYRKLITGYYTAGLGAVVGLGSALLLKFSGPTK